MRLRFLVAYDGTDFCGWQRQNHGPVLSVQQTLEEALARLFQQKITLFASGRTDAGVHALGQVCHVDLEVSESRFQNWDVCWALRALLPPSISVKKAWSAPTDFHATLSAVDKTYRYFIYNQDRANPFWRRTSMWERRPLDLDHLQECAKRVVGRHDFKSFQSVGTPVPHTVREVYEAHWERRSQNLLQFTIRGEGFLKQMVRNIVGTSLLLEKEKRDPDEISSIIKALDRQKAGAPAPAQGLFLMKVRYPRDLDKRCRPL